MPPQRYQASGAAIVLTVVAAWMGRHGITIIDPHPSFELQRVDLPSPADENDPLRVDAEHVLQGFAAPEDGIRLDNNDDDDDDDDWIWSMGNGDLLKVNLRTMAAAPFAHTGERHERCGEPDMEERCGRPLGLLKLPPDDRDRYQRFLKAAATLSTSSASSTSASSSTSSASTSTSTTSETEIPLFLVADAYKGLLLVSSSGTVVPLLTSVEGKPLFFANALARAGDGTIYLSDSSSRYRRNQVLLETLESQPTGRVVSWHPDTEISSVVADRLPFANGIVLRDSDSDNGNGNGNDRSLLVALTTRHNIVKIDLQNKGPPPAEHEVVAFLPGVPDNLHVAYSDEWKRSVLWVGTSTKSSPIVRLLNRQPRFRQLLAMLPRDLLLKCFKKYGLLLALDPDTGKLLRAYQDPSGTTSYIAGIHFDETHAYLGSWKNRFLARIPRDKLFAIDPS